MKNREQLATVILKTMQTYHKKIIHGCCHEGISMHQMNVLGHIIKNDGQPMSSYVKKLMMSKPNLSAMLNKFYEEGWIERVQDEKDRRITRIFITETGKEEFKKSKRIMISDMAMQLEALSDEDVEELINHYDSISQIFNKL